MDFKKSLEIGTQRIKMAIITISLYLILSSAVMFFYNLFSLNKIYAPLMMTLIFFAGIFGLILGIASIKMKKTNSRN